MKPLVITGSIIAAASFFAAGAVSMHILYALEAITNPIPKEGLFAAGIPKRQIIIGNLLTTAGGDENVVWPREGPAHETKTFGLRHDTSALVVLSNGEIAGSTPLPPSIQAEGLEFLMFTPERVYVYTGKAISGLYWVRH
jgi:hypothetical protein